MASDVQSNRERYTIFVILLIALGVRLVVAWLIPDQGTMFPDVASFRSAGQAFWSGLNLNYIYAMPLYPIIIGMFSAVWIQTLFDVSVSVVSVWLVYSIAKEVFPDRFIALLAALMTALYPPLIFFSVLGLTETLFIGLILAAFACWYRGYFTAAAVLAVLSILTRPVLDLAAPLLIVYFSFAIHHLSLAQALRNLAMYGLIYVALMTPWWVHNYYAYGTFVRLNLNYGISLYAGNNPLNKTGGGNLGVDFENTQFLKIVDPIARDQEYRRLAYSYITENPARFLKMSSVKLSRVWRLWPSNEGYTKPSVILGSLVTFGPILFLSLLYLSLWGLKEIKRTLPMLFLAAYLSAIAAVLFGTIRYRLPIEPFMIILSAAAMVRLAAQWELLERVRSFFPEPATRT